MFNIKADAPVAEKLSNIRCVVTLSSRVKGVTVCGRFCYIPPKAHHPFVRCVYFYGLLTPVVTSRFHGWFWVLYIEEWEKSQKWVWYTLCDSDCEYRRVLILYKNLLAFAIVEIISGTNESQWPVHTKRMRTQKRKRSKIARKRSK